jgi:hypothetical protein
VLPGGPDSFPCWIADAFSPPLLPFFFVFFMGLMVLALQRDGCPKIVNLGTAKTDLFYERKKYGFKQKT